MRSELETCEPIDDHCARSPKTKIHAAGVCVRCRLIGGHPFTKAETPRRGQDPANCPDRGELIGTRQCPTCKRKTIRMIVYTCPAHTEGATWQDCKACTVPA